MNGSGKLSGIFIAAVSAHLGGSLLCGNKKREVQARPIEGLIDGREVHSLFAAAMLLGAVMAVKQTVRLQLRQHTHFCTGACSGAEILWNGYGSI